MKRMTKAELRSALDDAHELIQEYEEIIDDLHLYATFLNLPGTANAILKETILGITSEAKENFVYAND